MEVDRTAEDAGFGGNGVLSVNRAVARQYATDPVQPFLRDDNLGLLSDGQAETGLRLSRSADLARPVVCDLDDTLSAETAATLPGGVSAVDPQKAARLGEVTAIQGYRGKLASQFSKSLYGNVNPEE